MRIVVTGKSGQVATALRSIDTLHEVIFIGRPEVDLANTESLVESVIAAKPDIIFSVAAYTNVDEAEKEPELVNQVNAKAPAALAKVAADLKIPILHLSTDYVFDGNKTDHYLESDDTNPQCVYGLSKRDGELAIAQLTNNHVILRTAWVFSPFGKNFVKTMLRLSKTHDHVNVVCDQRGCPTSAFDIAQTMLAVADRIVKDSDPQLRGIFHLTASGDASWAEFAEAVFDGLRGRGGKSVEVRPIATSQYPSAAKRPLNSRLCGDRLQQVYGIKIGHWSLALGKCMDALLVGSDT